MADIETSQKSGFTSFPLLIVSTIGFKSTILSRPI
jgi:hypothetical protein